MAGVGSSFWDFQREFSIWDCKAKNTAKYSLAQQYKFKYVTQNHTLNGTLCTIVGIEAVSKTDKIKQTTAEEIPYMFSSLSIRNFSSMKYFFFYYSLNYVIRYMLYLKTTEVQLQLRTMTKGVCRWWQNRENTLHSWCLNWFSLDTDFYKIWTRVLLVKLKIKIIRQIPIHGLNVKRFQIVYSHYTQYLMGLKMVFE